MQRREGRKEMYLIQKELPLNYQVSDKQVESTLFLSGSTACVALIKGDILYVANAGDSRCVLASRGQAVDMSVDHKPELES